MRFLAVGGNCYALKMQLGIMENIIRAHGLLIKL